MTKTPNDEYLRNHICHLEERLSNAAALASRTLQLEYDLGHARAAIASLKHKLFLIGSEETIQAAINEHSVGLFVKSPLPKIGIKPKGKRLRGRKL